MFKEVAGELENIRKSTMAGTSGPSRSGTHWSVEGEIYVMSGTIKKHVQDISMEN
jgi:hypothetical protein